MQRLRHPEIAAQSAAKPLTVGDNTRVQFSVQQVEEAAMAIRSPWHSAKPGIAVYHNNTICTEGNNIERHWWREGVGPGRRLCFHCAMLGTRR